MFCFGILVLFCESAVVDLQVRPLTLSAKAWTTSSPVVDQENGFEVILNNIYSDERFEQKISWETESIQRVWKYYSKIEFRIDRTCFSFSRIKPPPARAPSSIYTPHCIHHDHFASPNPESTAVDPYMPTFLSRRDMKSVTASFQPLPRTHIQLEVKAGH